MWVVLSVAYGVFRCILVWHYLEKYGISPLVFVIVELSSSCGFAIYSGKLVAAAIHQELSQHKRVAMITIMWFLLPDAYIFMSAGRMPGTVIGVIVTVSLLSCLIGATAVLRRLKTNSRQSFLADA